jgi:GR25 family glycosyltransferase involved in LPS biosynthesis|tara:strand:+ start:3092 stop:3751 length:660 start_codon:yes stop_codon:yes gene_type:complete
MRAYVITILDNEKSVKAAEKCIQSGVSQGLVINKWEATTPADEPFKILKDKGIIGEKLVEVYSRADNCAAAFLSHFSLWEKCMEIQEPIMIFEHDAVIVDQISERVLNGSCYKQMMSIGKPSYGQFRTPAFIGSGPLTSKKYFPGAHAYVLKPAAARQLISWTKTRGAAPTDVFLHKDNFPFLEEYFPWPVEARDTFTTIQAEQGCLAKHNYNKEYQIV